jgi:hypothetical protein
MSRRGSAWVGVGRRGSAWVGVVACSWNTMGAPSGLVETAQRALKEP